MVNFWPIHQIQYLCLPCSPQLCTKYTFILIKYPPFSTFCTVHSEGHYFFWIQFCLSLYFSGLMYKSFFFMYRPFSMDYQTCYPTFFFIQPLINTFIILKSQYILNAKGVFFSSQDVGRYVYRSGLFHWLLCFGFSWHHRCDV